MEAAESGWWVAEGSRALLPCDVSWGKVKIILKIQSNWSKVWSAYEFFGFRFVTFFGVDWSLTLNDKETWPLTMQHPVLYYMFRALREKTNGVWMLSVVLIIRYLFHLMWFFKWCFSTKLRKWYDLVLSWTVYCPNESSVLNVRFERMLLVCQKNIRLM